jgi:hypothetical protein
MSPRVRSLLWHATASESGLLELERVCFGWVSEVA